MSWRRHFCLLLASPSALDVDKISNGHWSLSKVHDFPPLTHISKGSPIKNTAIAKELVEFIRAVALRGGSGRVWNILGRDVTGAGEGGGVTGAELLEGAGTVRKGGELVMGGLGAIRHTLRQVLREGEATRILKIWGTRVGQARSAREHTVLRIINVKLKPRIGQGTFFSGGPEGAIIMHATEIGRASCRER